MNQHMKNFRAEDMPGGQGSESEEGSREQQRPEEQRPEEQQETQGTQEQETPPDGTTDEVLQWVGDDKERAQAALEKEQQEEKPRKRLTNQLEEIAGK